MIGFARNVAENENKHRISRYQTEYLIFINELNRVANGGALLSELIELISEKSVSLFPGSGFAVYKHNKSELRLEIQPNYYYRKMLSKFGKIFGASLNTIHIALKSDHPYSAVFSGKRLLIIESAPEIEKLHQAFSDAIYESKMIPIRTLKSGVRQVTKFLGMKSIVILPIVYANKAEGVLDIGLKTAITRENLTG